MCSGAFGEKAAARIRGRLCIYVSLCSTGEANVFLPPDRPFPRPCFPSAELSPPTPGCRKCQAAKCVLKMSGCTGHVIFRAGP